MGTPLRLAEGDGSGSPLAGQSFSEICFMSAFCLLSFGLNIQIAPVCTVAGFFWGWLWGMVDSTGLLAEEPSNSPFFWQRVGIGREN